MSVFELLRELIDLRGPRLLGLCVGWWSEKGDVGFVSAGQVGRG